MRNIFILHWKALDSEAYGLYLSKTPLPPRASCLLSLITHLSLPGRLWRPVSLRPRHMALAALTSSVALLLAQAEKLSRDARHRITEWCKEYRKHHSQLPLGSWCLETILSPLVPLPGLTLKMQNPMLAAGPPTPDFDLTLSSSIITALMDTMVLHLITISPCGPGVKHASILITILAFVFWKCSVKGIKA